MKRTLVLLALLIGLGLIAIPACAQQITLNASSQDVSFTGEGTNSLDVVFGSCVTGTCTLSGTAVGTDGEAGTYSFVTTGYTDGADFGPNNGFGVFPLITMDGATTVFNFTDTTDGDSNLVNIPVTWVSVNDGSSNPHLTFTTPLSGTVSDFILKPLVCPQGCPNGIDDVAATPGNTANAQISSGEVFVPEPASMALLGTALFGAYGLLRRRVRL